MIHTASDILDAVSRGDCPAVRRCLGGGADVNCRDTESKLTLLMIAAGRGDHDSVEVLIKAGADVLGVEPNAGASVLHKACQGGSVKVARLLVEAGAFIDAVAPTTGHTPLMDALWYKWPEVVEYLLSSGANLNVFTHYGFSLQQHFQYELNVNIVGKDRLLKSEQLLKKRRASDQQAQQTQLLMSAASRGALTTVRQLIASGAKIDERFPIVGGFNDGHTPLLVTCREGHAEIAAELLKAGADVNAVEPVFGAVPLHKAVYNGRADITALLVEQPGVDLNFQGATNGYTPLHDALWHGYIECANVLLDKGARCDVRGHDGKTALCIALEAFGSAVDVVGRIRQSTN